MLNPLFSYKVKPWRAKDVGRELGVQYLVEGGVEQHLPILEVGSVEALGELVVDCGEHRARPRRGGQHPEATVRA
jgi:hypothetical protein